jgi:hypothetical protein
VNRLTLNHQAIWRSSRQQQQHQQEQQQKNSCNKGCGQLIYFDANNKQEPER